jgi:hypothetical protein
MKNQSELPEKFSNNPEENLRIENEILKMRINAEFGGISGGIENIPPDLENQFLRNVIEFEQQWADSKKVKLGELLGNPEYPAEADLDDKTLATEFETLVQLLASKNIEVDFIRERDNRFKYRFITEELLGHETDDMMVPGMIKHFTYEELHPDHEMELRDRTMEFLSGWFERDCDRLSFCLGKDFTQPDGLILSQEDLLKKIQRLFDSYRKFENCKYFVAEIKFHLQEGSELQGLGHSEGAVKYDGVLENGEIVNLGGNFKLYFTRVYDWWSIYFFYMTGFNI